VGGEGGVTGGADCWGDGVSADRQMLARGALVQLCALGTAGDGYDHQGNGSPSVTGWALSISRIRRRLLISGSRRHLRLGAAAGVGRPSYRRHGWKPDIGRLVRHRRLGAHDGRSRSPQHRGECGHSTNREYGGATTWSGTAAFRWGA
jgi:hypothetical protein